MLTGYINQLMGGVSLNLDQAEQLMSLMLQSKQREQIAAVLALMRAKGETALELSAFVRVLRRHQLSINLSMPVCDIVGTGGDGAGTANISTMASIIVAACGVPVLKHGNRAVSSRCGSADVLEALGLNIEGSPDAVVDSIYTHGFGFCYAPVFNPAFQTLKSVRQQLKIPTLFNLIGPLLNPGRAQTLLLGVGDPSYLNRMADCLATLGVERAMVVHGQGLDELNTLGSCEVIELKDGKKFAYSLDPEAIGFPLCRLKDLEGGDASHNALLFKRVLEGEDNDLANTVILNAAAALYLAGHAESIVQGVPRVRDVIACGHAKQLMEDLSHA